MNEPTARALASCTGRARAPSLWRVTIGVALGMIAVGAILRWAITGTLSWLDVQTAGLVLVVVGIAALVAALYQAFVLGVERTPPR